MNKTATLAILFGSTLTACSSTPPYQANTALINNCRVPSVAEVEKLVATGCEDVAGNKLTVTVHSDRIDVEPEYICAERGKRLRMEVRRGEGLERNAIAVAVPKDAEVGWIIAFGRTGGRETLMRVPQGVRKGLDFGYTILTSNGLCKDPMIHIER